MVVTSVDKLGTVSEYGLLCVKIIMQEIYV